MFLISAGKSLLNHAFYIKCEEKHNKGFPLKRCRWFWANKKGELKGKQTPHICPLMLGLRKTVRKDKSGGVDLGILLNEPAWCNDSLRVCLPEEGGSPQGPSNPIHSCPGRVLNFWKKTNWHQSIDYIFSIYRKRTSYIFNDATSFLPYHS